MKKFQRCPFCSPCTQRAKRSKRDTKKIFTGHGLRITNKRPAVWYFSIFLFEKYQFLLEIFYLHLESSSASRKWKNLNVVLFAYSDHRVRRHPSVTLKKKFSSDSSGQNLKYCEETVKWRTANVLNLKQLTICPGWLLRKTISVGFLWSGNFALQEIGSLRALHQGWKWAFKRANYFHLTEFWCPRFHLGHQSPLQADRDLF